MYEQFSLNIFHSTGDDFRDNWISNDLQKINECIQNKIKDYPKNQGGDNLTANLLCK